MIFNNISQQISRIENFNSTIDFFKVSIKSFFPEIFHTNCKMIVTTFERSNTPGHIPLKTNELRSLVNNFRKAISEGEVDYEQSNETSIAGRARADDVSIWEKRYIPRLYQ